MFAKIQRLIRALRNSKLSLVPPRQKAVIQVHQDGYDLLVRYTDPKKILVVDPSRFNFWILVRCVFLRRLNMIGYIQTVIEIVKPQLVITFIDNDPSFYTLKSLIPDPSFIAVQNGLRHNYSYAHKNGLVDLFLDAKKKSILAADLICTFGNNSSKFFTKYVDSTTLVTGNLRNNDLVISSPNNSDFDIVFMSQHAPFDVSTSSEVVYLNDSSISIQDFYKIESDVAKFLAQYCQDRSLKFAVSGKRGPEDSFESDFYTKAIGGLPFTFLPRLDQTSSYENAYRAKLVIVIDSTIGYELLSRGKKVAFFSARKIGSSQDQDQNKDTCFGYPSEYPDSGPFWTNQPDTNEYTRILDDLFAYTEADWSLLHKQYTEDLMALRPGSPEFIGALKALGVASTSEVVNRA
jgi:surface carbohydrate biosynthesis protein